MPMNSVVSKHPVQAVNGLHGMLTLKGICLFLASILNMSPFQVGRSKLKYQRLAVASSQRRFAWPA